MRIFYLIIAFGSGIYLVIQLIAHLFFGRRLFADTGELFTERQNKFEWQTVFPKNLLRLIAAIFAASLMGLLLTHMGVVNWLSMLCACAGGVAFNFLLSTVAVPLYMRLTDSGTPTDEQLSGMRCEVISDITEEGYGAVRVKHGAGVYEFNAVTANGRDLPAGTIGVVLYSEDGLCFVESEARLYDVLFEEDTSDGENE